MKLIRLTTVLFSLSLSISLVLSSLPSRAETQQDKLINYGDFYLHKGKLSEALSYYEKALKGAVKKDVYYLKRGIVLNKLDRPKEALRDFNKVIELSPQMSKAFLWRGETYSDMGMYKKAIVDFNKALKLPGPERILLFRWRATAKNGAGDTEGAIKDSNRAIRIILRQRERHKDPAFRSYELARMYELRGNLYYNQKQYELASSDFENSLKNGINTDTVYDILARSYANFGDYKQAVRVYSKLISFNKRDDSAYARRGQIYMKMKQYKNAAQDFTLAIDNYPGESPFRLYLQRAEAYEKAGLKSRAAQDRITAKKAKKKFYSTDIKF